ncbi:CASP-like protein [Musa troglodytarum]|uniref:CASP-like protein n=1 Tax=Musa troglodytarum TaxID=320322 RepID=A0A9E7FHH5_9LILI|nr:CASP-like protein [Musa troglodytarum]
MVSPRRSPMRDAENPTPPLSPPAKTPSRPQTPAREDRPVASPLRSLVSSPAKTPSRPQTPAREDGPVVSHLRSPLRRAELPTPPRTPPDVPAVTIVNRLSRDGVSPAEKVISEGHGGLRAGEGGSVRGALGLRVAAFVLSMIAFSVMAADKTEGWAGDSFDRYKEFRYLVAVNVLAFAYSAFQVCEKIYREICTRHIMSRRMGCYFDLSMDQASRSIGINECVLLSADPAIAMAKLKQNTKVKTRIGAGAVHNDIINILAYLLMSASSAAASRNDVWVSRFGSDGFTHKANASIAMSFLAFVALALSSLVSAYKLFGRSS